jgi:hypothetical protein
MARKSRIVTSKSSTVLPALLFVLVVISACRGVSFLQESASGPDGSEIQMDARLAAVGRGYYTVYASIRNGTREEIRLSPNSFSLECPAPLFFVQASTISWGRPGFRIARSVPPGQIVKGEIYYGIRGGSIPDSPVTFVAHLPDGDHRVVFTVD